MHISKKFISILAMAAFLGMLAYIGIRDRYNSTIAPVEEVTDSVKTLHLWYTDETLTDFFTGAAVAFHERNADVRVIPTLVGETEYVEAVYKASLDETGEYPDIFMISNDSLEKAYLCGVASECGSYSKVLNRNHFPQTALNAVSYKNQLIAYPLFFETSVLAYNRTYLEQWAEKVNSGEVDTSKEQKLTEEEIEALRESGEGYEASENTETESEETGKEVTADDYVPKTIDELLSFADIYDAPDGVSSVCKWDVNDILYNYFFTGNYMVVGGPAGDDSTSIDIYNAGAISCLQAYQNMKQFFSIDSTACDYTDVINEFIDGKCLFTVVSSDAIIKLREAEEQAQKAYSEAAKLASQEAERKSAYENSNSHPEEAKDSDDEDDDKDEDKKEEPEETELQKKARELKEKVFDFEFVRIPMISDKFDSRSLSVTDCLAVNGFSLRMKEANEFAEFATTEYSSNLYSKSGKIASSLDDSYEDADLDVFRSEYEHSVSMPKIMETSNFWVQLETTFTKVWDGGDIQTLVQSLADLISEQIIEPEEETEATE